MLETLDYTIRIGSTPTFSYFDLYVYSAYAAHYVQCYVSLFKYGIQVQVLGACAQCTVYINCIPSVLLRESHKQTIKAHMAYAVYGTVIHL